MRRRNTELPPAFSLLKSEFNDFLYAPIGEDNRHQQLTVLSAFAREGLDPWQQAARLRKLPNAVARRDLASIIVALPNAPCSMVEIQALSDRLIAFLPPRPSLQARLAEMIARFRVRLFRLTAR